MIKLRSYIQDIVEGLAYLHNYSNIYHNIDYVHMDIRLETLHCTRGAEDLIRIVFIYWI
jgi:calcium/calmodulin-dependent protein kinase I